MWYAELESKIFTRIKYELSKEYPNLYCTTASTSDKPTKFPTLYLHELQPIEVGADLEGNTVNAVMETIEMQIFSNQSEKECKQIATSAIEVMKSMSFQIAMFPDPQTRNDRVSFAIARCRRIIAQGDTI